MKQLLSQTRLLTLTGAGGVGKTRLAIQVVKQLASQYQDRIWWVDLFALHDPALVPQAVAHALGVLEVQNVPLVETLAGAICDKTSLLVLDNCEHLVTACAQLSEILLGACESLKIMTTSREALGIAGETLWRVPSLSLADPEHPLTLQELDQYESARLFVERARAVKADLTLTERDGLSIARICRRLDGIPLAIELAAARVTLLSPREIESYLSDRFNLLTTGSRTALPRQQTLQAAIDWSYDLLTGSERTLFRRLTVFAGGWTLAAAEAICALAEIRPSEILALLGRLVDKSLVVVEMETRGATRYSLLESMCEYSRQKSLEAGEWDRLRDRHLEFYQKFVEVTRPTNERSQGRDWILQVEVELDNLRAALEWGMQSNVNAVLEMTANLMNYWWARGHAAEARHWITEALARVEMTPKLEDEAGRRQTTLRANALLALATVTFSQGDNTQAIAFCEQAEGLARELGNDELLASILGYQVLGMVSLRDTSGVEERVAECLRAARQSANKPALGMGLVALGAVHALKGSHVSARRETEEGIALLEESGYHSLAAIAIVTVGVAATLQGDYAEARRRFMECLPMFQELGDQRRVNVVKSELAHIERKEGHYDRAALLYRETIQEWQRLDNRGPIAHELECLAMIAKAREEFVRALRLFGAAQVLRERIGMPMSDSERVEYEREVADLRTNTDEQTFTSSWSAGRALSMDQAIEFALHGEDRG